jgi:two-component system, chemotaxis family, CheB/CheR fusion protein
VTAVADPSFEGLLEFLKRARGLDLTHYKRPALERRFKRRMLAARCDAYADYRDHLELHPDEFEPLFDTLLINVTGFFRDPAAWQRLRERVIPALLARKPDGEPLRVWSAGCASGEEAYSIATALAEQLGDEAYRARVKIYGTDIDEEALGEARAALYTGKQLEGVPEELRARYFEPVDARHGFRADLRRTVIFGRNDLLQDAPISRLDLLVCRNTLMYFTAEAQARILRNFHFALADGGILMLGRSEMLRAHREAFAAVDLSQRIFRRDGKGTGLRPRAAAPKQRHRLEPAAAEEERRSRDAALEAAAQPQLIVSRDGRLTFANLTARTLFDVSGDDLGRPFADLALSYRPVELRGPVGEALRERRTVALGEVRFAPDEGGERCLDVTVTPLLSGPGATAAVSIVFDDVSRYASLRRELEGNRRDLELAYVELQSTIDELETTNEELETMNEELETMNEELQSTNEELETMNEELQSTNDELETINDELRDRSAELDDVNEFLEAILASLGLALAVLDQQQRVQVWNHRAEDLWGLRHDEAVDHDFLTLDIGLPTEALAPALRGALTGAGARGDVVVQAVNRRGRVITCAATIMPLGGSGDGGRARGAIVLMRDLPPAR